MRIFIPPLSLWDNIFLKSKHLLLPPSHQTQGDGGFFQMIRSRWHPESWDAPGSSLLGCHSSLKQTTAMPVCEDCMPPRLSSCSSSSSSRGISKEQTIITGFLIYPDWLLGALKNWYHSHGDRSTEHHMSPATDSPGLCQRCQCSHNLRSRKENVEAPSI